VKEEGEERMGTTVLLTKNETTFFVLSFLLLLVFRSPSVVILFAIALTTLFILKRKELYFLWSILAPRINGSAPILSNLLSLAQEEGPGNGELPDLMEIHIPFLPSLYFIFKREYTKRILSLEPDNFPTGGDSGPMVKIAADSGKNILLVSGPPNPHWIKYREVTSFINKDRFGENSLVGQMFQQTWKTTQELSVSHFGPKLGVPIDLFKELYHVMIPAHNRALFGEEWARKFSYAELNEEIYDIITETGKQLKFDWCPPTVKEAYYAKINRVKNAVFNMGKDSPSTFMKSLLEATKKGVFTEEELLSNLLIFEYAQAPLHVAFWMLYALALHPEEEKRVVAEIASVLSQGPLTYDRLPEFKYLSRCLAETLRLYPGVGLMQVRSAGKNTQFGSHYVPQGSLIFLCQYIIQRNATYWPNPDEFIPSREGIDPSQYGENLAYLPFGNGPRQCQGQYFAQDFVKVTVISMLQHYKINLSGQQQAVPTEIGFLRPAYPVFAELEKRNLPSPAPPAPVSPPSPSPSPSRSRSPSPSRSSAQVMPSTSRPKLELESLPSASQRPTLRKRPTAPKLSKASKSATLISQSQIFKASMLSSKKLVDTHDVLVLWGSQTGTARGLATRVVRMAELCNLSATLVPLSEFDVKTVKQYKAVVVVTATYGDGGAPESAEKFENWLENETATDLLSGVRYAVLALGSSMYPFPFRFGSLVNRRFAQLGGTSILREERIDEIKYNTQEVFTDWSARLFDAITAKIQALDTSSRELVVKNKMLGFQNFDFNVLQVPFTLTFTNQRLPKENRKHFQENLVVSKVKRNVLINSEPTNQIFSIDVELPAGSRSFQAGDNSIVLPSNPASEVNRLIECLGFDKEKVFEVSGQELNQVTDLACSLGQNKCTLEIALSHYYDITSTPSASMLQFFAIQSNDPEDQKTLLSYVSNYFAFLKLNLSVIDLLETTPSIQLEGKEEKLSVFLGLLGPIKQRHYSIANFPGATPNVMRIVYKVVTYHTKSGQEKHGLCSNYLKSKKEGEEIVVGIVKSKFRLPSDSSVPVVMVGAGSGISPYFGFLEQRADAKNNGQNLGKAVLAHGCRSEADFANKEKTEEALKSGIISDLWPAYSRKVGAPKLHVQDVVKQKGAELWKLLNEDGAIVYVCGDVAVGISVRDALVQIAQEHGKFGPYKAHSWLLTLIKDGRLRNDEWGIATSSGAHAIRAARLKLWRKSILAIFAFAKKQ
jgi:NADPH-ferrihemoprotein reductase